ncbi:TonB-dependent receptor [Sandaracinobacter sp. RS1-74]|uniref:TonB-dependent receptor n=1 Tax=Sandaracinobacteroides sayramensis TaxID=2913411 RepID=UPI001EDC661A|nr:TonB-dependent receptor [Sandaracinobacteroides sayramensis]MCG2840126.1 TonB-dependent receptor [Sandaracinobacteroides sayramensis]
MRDFHYVSLLALAASLAAPAAAQTPAASSAAEPVLADIVVTGTKREERLQDVPQSISLVDSQALQQQNIANVNDLARAVPSFNTSYGSVKIRGLGAQTYSRSAEGSVGVVLDGVALSNASTQANPAGLFDVARVEVLMGPQGTLFGRNSSAGVVNIVTNAPDPSRMEMAFHGEVGNRNQRRVQAMANLPVGDVAALRLSAQSSRTATTTYNVPRFGWDDLQSSGVRARFLVEPSEKLTINLIADYEKFSNTGGGWVVVQSTPGSFLTNQLNACGIVIGPDNRSNCYSGQSYGRDKAYGVSGQIDWQIGEFTLTSITANRWLKQDGGGDSDSVPVDVLDVNASTQSISNFSQEIRLTSPSGGFAQFVVGGYYFRGKQDATGIQMGSLRILPFGLKLGQTFETEIDSKSLAAFGQATFNLTDSLRLIAGARLERQEIEADTVRQLAPGALAPFASLAPVSGSNKDTSFSYRGGLQYDFSPDLMAYVTYARGYKGAAINDQTTTVLAPLVVKPEIPKAWEGGVKATLLDSRMVANLAIFRTDVENYQTQFLDSATATYIYGNAPSIRSQGVELSVMAKLTPGLSLNGGLTFTDATYGDGYLVACGPNETEAQGCRTYTVGATTTTASDAGGRRLSGVPKWKFVASGEYRAPVSDHVELYAQADVVHTSSIGFTASYDPLAATGSHTPVGARLGVAFDGGNINLSVFGRNIFNERVPLAVAQTPLAAQLGDLGSYIHILSPESVRSIGVALDFKF